MRRALSVIELIFVLVIIAILSAAVLYGYKPKHLRNDIDYLYMKILQAKYRGLAYDKRLRDTKTRMDVGCIDLGSDGIAKSAKADGYGFRSKIVRDFGVLCFDRFGRPHKDDNTTANAPLATPTLLVELRYAEKNASLSILPQTGYVIINY